MIVLFASYKSQLEVRLYEAKLSFVNVNYFSKRAWLAKHIQLDWLYINNTFLQLLMYFQALKGTNNCEMNLLIVDILDTVH